MEIIDSLFEVPIKKFKEHLEIDGNYKTILSGIYGIGKTTFIKYFFSDKIQELNLGKKKFIPIYLYPINYSVSNNEDIFTYIKYDILYELLAQEDFKLDQKFTIFETLPHYIFNNIDDLLKSLYFAFDSVGKEAFHIFEKIFKHFDKFKTYHKGINNLNKISIDNFAINITEKEGSIYENNFISDIIQSFVVNIKEVNEDCEIVLIIDDLDRIEPTHIFRLFNIFSAHFDTNDDSNNKFGFDKIVFVSDILNIRKIYKNKYGQDIDFNGYIDKFYSKKVFYYDNKESIKSIITNILNSINYCHDSYNNHSIKNSISHNEILLNILYLLIINNKLNLRSLLRYRNKFIDLNITIIDFPIMKIESSKFPVFNEIRLLYEIYGDYENLIESLEYCKSKINSSSPFSKTTNIGRQIHILDFDQNKFSHDSEKIYNYKNFDYDFDIQYKFDFGRGERYKSDIIGDIKFPENFKANKTHFNYIYFEIELIKLFHKLGVLE